MATLVLTCDGTVSGLSNDLLTADCSTGWVAVDADMLKAFPDLAIADAEILAGAIILLFVLAWAWKKVQQAT